MANVVQTMINSALGDGARSTKFECIIGLDSFKAGSKMLSAVVKTASFPGKSHEVIDLKFKGRNIPIKGQTKYENTWSCTFYLDEMHSLKKAFEDEIESLDVHNFGDNIIPGKSSYARTLTVIQLDFDGSQQTAVYNLYNVFPKSVSQVDVDYSEVGKVQEFTVEFSYSHFDSLNTKSSNGSFTDGVKQRFINAVDGLIQQGKEAAIAALSDVIGSARDLFTGGSGSFVSGIGSSISGLLTSLEQMDFNPSNMIE
jgi:hypothetical protein